MNVFEFARRVEDDEKAYAFALELGLVSSAPHCPTCLSEMRFERGKVRRGVNGIWRCVNPDCTNTAQSIFKNSVIDTTKLPPSKFLKVLFCLAEMKNVQEVMFDAGVSNKKVVQIHQTVRRMMSWSNQRHRQRIGGAGMTVEIDECKIRTRKYNVGRVVAGSKLWVVGGICRETRRMFAVITAVRDKDTLKKILFENVEKDSTIYTDCWRGYVDVEEMGLGFVHGTVNHTTNFVNPTDPDIYTNTVERSWRSLKEALPKQVGLEHVQSYIERFLFFHHAGCRNSGERFQAIVNLCQAFYPVN